MPGGKTGREPADPALLAWTTSVCPARTTEGLSAEAEGEGGTSGPAEPRTGGPMSFVICSRDIGPRRYDIVQRVWKTTGFDSWTLWSRNTRLASADRIRSASARFSDPAAAPSRPSSTRALSRSVCSRPRNQVPMFDESLVVEIDRVLRREHDPTPKARACFSSVSSGALDGGFATGGK